MGCCNAVYLPFIIGSMQLKFIFEIEIITLLTIVILLFKFSSGIPSQPVTLFHSPIHLTVNDYRLSMKCMPHKHYLNYKWERRGGSLPSGALGAYTSNLIIVNLRPEDAGDYRCVVSNSTGTINSNFSSLLITGKFFSIICMYVCIAFYIQVNFKAILKIRYSQ